MNKKNGFFETLFQYSLISWVSFLISFISVPIMTRLFSPEQMGGINMFQSMLSLLLMVTLIGQDQAFARYYHENENKGETAQSSYYLATLTWGIMAMFIYFVPDSISSLIFGEVNRYAMIMTALVALPLTYLRLSEQIYRMKSKTKAYGIQQVVFNLTTKIGVLGSVFIAASYNSYITAYGIVVFLLGLLFIRNQYCEGNITLSNRIPVNRYKEMLAFGIPSMISSVAFSLKDFIPRLVLSSYVNLYSVGIYSAAISLAATVSIIQAGFSTYFVAYFYENYKKNPSKFEKIHNVLTGVLVLAAISITAFSDIMVKLLDNSYESASKIFPIVLWSPVAIAISETTVYGINIAKKTKYHAYIAIFTALFTLILSISLIPMFGMLGAAYSIGLSGLFFLALRTHYGLKYLKLINNLKRTMVSLAIMVIYSTINSLVNLPFQSKLLLFGIFVIILGFIYQEYLSDVKQLLKARKYKQK